MFLYVRVFRPPSLITPLALSFPAIALKAAKPSGRGVGGEAGLGVGVYLEVVVIRYREPLLCRHIATDAARAVVAGTGAAIACLDAVRT